MPSFARTASSSNADDTERSTPFAARAIDAARVHAEHALERAQRGDPARARTAIDDASLLIEGAEDAESAARVGILIGEALLAIHEAHRARDRFESSLAALDRAGDARSIARGLLGLARALERLGEASARAAFEDAGLRYEDLGDDDAVRAIDLELRALEAQIEESPRSFSSHPRIALRRAD